MHIQPIESTDRLSLMGILARVSLLVGSLAAVASPAQAQACFGHPTDGVVSYQNARYSHGTGHGGGISASPGPFALAANANTRSMQNEFVETSGLDGTGRVAFVLSMGPVQLCPGISVGYMKLSQKFDEFELSNQQFTGRGGAGIGLEQHLYKGISIIPSLGVHYDFSARKYDVIADDGNNETTGDSLTRISIEYSVGVRYRMAYLGAIAERYGDNKAGRPTKVRFVLGFAFGSVPMRE